MTTGDTVTVGVEEEFHLAEPAERAQAPAAERVLGIAAEQGGELAAELQRSQVETATPVCRTLDELAAQLADRRRGLLAAADRAGVGVVTAGTLPGAVAGGQSPYPRQRYEWLVAEYADVAREQLVCALVRRGTATDRQRAVYARRERLADVVDALVAETRAGL